MCGVTLSSRQISQGVDWFSSAPNLKVQFRPIATFVSKLGDLLSPAYKITLLHEYLAVVCVGAEEVLIVFDDDERPVTDQTTACVHHLALRGCQHRITKFSCDINPFIDSTGSGKGINNRARMWPLPLKVRT